MFRKGNIQIDMRSTIYNPGDIISGNVILTLRKPVTARELSISLIGEQIIRRSGGVTRSGRRSTTTQRFIIYIATLQAL